MTQSWQNAEVAPALTAGTVHIWRIYLPELLQAPLPLSVLSSKELLRVERLLRPKHQLQLGQCQAIKRMLLAQYAQRAPDALQFQQQGAGKPYLVDSPIKFNLSHSQDWLLLAVSQQAVGIDIEWQRPELDVMGLSQRYFTSGEVAYLESLAGGGETVLQKAFFDIWTRKEAVLKQAGFGLSFGLNQFSVLADIVQLPDSEVELLLAGITVAAGYSSSVAAATLNDVAWFNYAGSQ